MTPEIAQGAPLTLSPYDIGIVVILFLSAFVGVFRGLTKEVLSIAGWVCASLVTTYAYIPLRGIFRTWIGNAFLADMATILFVFITSLVIFTMIIGSISDKVKRSRLGGLDRSLGLVFGGVRGGAIVVIVFMLSLFLWKTPQERPIDLQNARSRPLLEQGTRALFSLAPKGLVPENLWARVQPSQNRTPEELMKALSQPKPQEKEPSKPEEDSALPYNKIKRQELDRLVKTLEKLS
jgi:membrane protein required for colicin V production